VLVVVLCVVLVVCYVVCCFVVVVVFVCGVNVWLLVRWLFRLLLCVVV
jgi:hypothetical protein